ncbi:MULTISPECIES: hypothetical protein [Thermomonospora]|uniref:Transglycosylase SLT domain-containing protein n=1 Tax=Thermomonospora curvata (strain ATCC 19995 / DSM 43183 / JCM 3096 / KCTC 9072 / NBRC 15933 / NCIMB 10081 / Henssen B9) TaxID=471852 RepID=D1AD54_THECD|nr:MULTISPECIES: hypothetical protein [Thermomonospora]ACY99363.1 hypothetical protein Tcur_3832 [Thermomonospora curvata DSM 43183]
MRHSPGRIPDPPRRPAPRPGAAHRPPRPPHPPLPPAGRSGRRRKRRRLRLVRRVLTSNVTITLAAIAGLLAVALNITSLNPSEPKPPALAAELDLSTNELVALLTRTDMDAVAADAIAQAKRRAHLQQLEEERKARERAEWYRKNRDKIEAAKQAEKLRAINPSAAQNKAYGKLMNKLKGWEECWPSLENLWERESNWNERARNPYSGAYGIPQALPAEKLASAGADWRTSSPTQIAWGLGYIKARYGNPCKAWQFWQANHWY